VLAADEGGAEAGELALAGVGEAAEEGFGDDEAEDGVADELELFVVPGGFGALFGGAFVGEGAVGEGPAEERGVAEAVAKELVGGRNNSNGFGGFGSTRLHEIPSVYCIERVKGRGVPRRLEAAVPIIDVRHG